MHKTDNILLAYPCHLRYIVFCWKGTPCQIMPPQLSIVASSWPSVRQQLQSLLLHPPPSQILWATSQTHAYRSQRHLSPASCYRTPFLLEPAFSRTCSTTRSTTRSTQIHSPIHSPIHILQSLHFVVLNTALPQTHPLLSRPITLPQISIQSFSILTTHSFLIKASQTLPQLHIPRRRSTPVAKPPFGSLKESVMHPNLNQSPSMPSLQAPTSLVSLQPITHQMPCGDSLVPNWITQATSSNSKPQYQPHHLAVHILVSQ